MKRDAEKSHVPMPLAAQIFLGWTFNTCRNVFNARSWCLLSLFLSRPGICKVCSQTLPNATRLFKVHYQWNEKRIAPNVELYHVPGIKIILYYIDFKLIPENKPV
uniref:Secreted protein n=1 Tax=Romanomermis culicivorax TaxID=13658 RepID=A0A915HXW3_ROMCU